VTIVQRVLPGLGFAVVHSGKNNEGETTSADQEGHVHTRRVTTRKRFIDIIAAVVVIVVGATLSSCATSAPATSGSSPSGGSAGKSSGGGSDITDLVDWSLPPAFGTVDLESGFIPDPYLVGLTAGGRQNLERVGRTGYVAEAPDYDLNYVSGSFNLYIFVESQGADTVLLVCDPSGRYFYSDDRIGTRPGIVFQDPESGLYDIWVGTYNPSNTSATLAISEIRPTGW
jgi:hypothetical protein